VSVIPRRLVPLTLFRLLSRSRSAWRCPSAPPSPCTPRRDSWAARRCRARPRRGPAWSRIRRRVGRRPVDRCQVVPWRRTLRNERLCRREGRRRAARHWLTLVAQFAALPSGRAWSRTAPAAGAAFRSRCRSAR